MDRGTSEKATGNACISTISGPTVGVDPFPRLLDRHPSPCYNHINITVTALWVATPFLSTVSVAAVCVAVTTNQWLLTQENIKNENYTGRGENEYFPKNTVSGLWTLCYTNPGKRDFFCSNIEYFPREEYSPDLKDSTMAIPYTVTKSAAFFILSTFMLFVGELCCLFGHFSRQRRLFTFISGVVFIISGLLMLIGLVMYISIFKAEVGGKLRPTSQLQPAVFTYKYGYSFILYVAGFVSTEISGTCAVFLYIYWHQKDWRRKGYHLRPSLPSPLTSLHIDPNIYPFCRRHPHNLSANTLPPNPHPRLYLHPNPHLHTPSPSPSPTPTPTPTPSPSSSENYPPPPTCPNHPSSLFLTHNSRPKDASTNTTAPWQHDPHDTHDHHDSDPDDYCSSTLHDHHFVPFDLDEGPSPLPPIDHPPHSPNRSIPPNDLLLGSLTRTTPV